MVFEVAWTVVLAGPKPETRFIPTSKVFSLANVTYIPGIRLLEKFLDNLKGRVYYAAVEVDPCRGHEAFHGSRV